MPSIFNKSSPFVSLRPEKDCGRQGQKTTTKSGFKNYNGSASDEGGSKRGSNHGYSSANGHAINGNGKGFANGYADGAASSRS